MLIMLVITKLILSARKRRVQSVAFSHTHSVTIRRRNSFALVRNRAELENDKIGNRIEESLNATDLTECVVQVAVYAVLSSIFSLHAHYHTHRGTKTCTNTNIHTHKFHKMVRRIRKRVKIVD